MQHSENDFSPLLVDQQIEQPASSLSRGGAYLVNDLHAIYDQDKHAAINWVWTRLSSQQPRQPAPSQQEQDPESISLFKERAAYLPQRKREPRRASAFVRRLNLLAAVLVVALLVGALAFVFAMLHPGTSTGTPLIPLSGWGKIVHVETLPDSGFNGPVWSPDSKRVAVSYLIPSNNRLPTTNVVRIWDATTGQHQVTVPAPDFVNTLAWSPNSQQVAIETNQSVIIVDGQTGHVIRTFTVPGQSSAFAASGVMPLASRFPASGGPGLRGITWSPDGSQIAASFFGDAGASFPEAPAVLVWNLQTGALSRLLLRSNNDIDGAVGSVGWSSNGEYIAADTVQTAYTNSLSQGGVVVWKVATRQIILQKNTGSLPDLNPALAWQPGTLNLAQIGVVKAGSGYTTAILIFDGTTGKMLKQLVVPVNDVLAWSPDGKYLAYTSSADVETGNTAQILDASTWRVVYTYKDNTNMIKGLVWSPNGHDIATGESFIENNTVAGVVRVWEALD